MIWDFIFRPFFTITLRSFNDETFFFIQLRGMFEGECGICLIKDLWFVGIFFLWTLLEYQRVQIIILDFLSVKEDSFELSFFRSLIFGSSLASTIDILLVFIDAFHSFDFFDRLGCWCLFFMWNLWVNVVFTSIVFLMDTD